MLSPQHRFLFHKLYLATIYTPAMIKNILTAIILTVTTTLAFSQEKPMPLYPNGVPNSKPTPATYVEN
jgi:hypothetical protein